MTRQIKLGPIVRLGFGSILCLMTGLGIVSWVTVRRLNDNIFWVNHTHTVIGQLRWLEKSLVDTETGQRGFLVSDREIFLEPYVQGKETVNQLLVTIQELTRDNPTQQANITELQQLINLTLQELETGIQLKREGKETELVNRFTTGEGKRRMDAVRAEIASMIELEESLLLERDATVATTSRVATLINLGGTLSAIFFGLLVLGFIQREVIQPINQVASQLSNSSSEIATAVEEQERIATNQASVTTQTSTTMDELGVSSRQSAEQAEAAASAAQEVLQLSQGGNQAVDRTLQGMVMLQGRVSEIANLIGRLSTQTKEIAHISDLVSDLANQTNMLALNAAVEAVRAGEHGKGFAVVSGEVRKLADQSKASAEQINALVHDIQTAITATVVATDTGTQTVEESIQIAEATSQAFSGVMRAVDHIVVNSRQISLNAQQQATAIEQVVLGMGSLTQAAQENAAGVSQVKAETRRLNDNAFQLQTIV